MDVKTDFTGDGKNPYTPENYDLKFRGPIQIRFALGNSLNIPAVKMLAMIGLKDFLQRASDVGMPELAPNEKNLQNLGLSASLGGGATSLLHLTSSYTVFANGGKKVDISAIKEIKDAKGKTIFKAKTPNAKQVLSPEVSFLISHILSDDNARSAEFGAGSQLVIPGKTVAVKTGTSNDKRDNYAVGFTKGVTVGVWVGNNDYSPMNNRIASGITGATPIWHQVMTQLLKKYKDGIMDKPDKVKALEIDSYLGGLPHDGDPKRSEYFVEGTEPKSVSPFYQKLKISKANGKLANEVEVKNGNYDEKEFIVFKENDPLSIDGKNRWQEGIDNWVKDQGDPKFHPPTDTSDSSAEDVVVSIKDPSDKQTINSNHVNFRARIYSVVPIKNVKFYIDGSEIKSQDGNNDEVTDAKDLSDGSHEFKVVAVNEKDKRGESTIRFGVNKAWDAVTPTNTPVPTSAPPSPTSGGLFTPTPTP
jgi:membrane carboxypeptidase/penicillin-binding protein PbpC